MAYTFGGATTDDATITFSTNFFGDNSCQLIVGTWYPTTLTASRCYWSFGSTNRLAVNATNTDELTLFTNNNTTPGQWATTGADITVDQWWFIAAMFAAENTSVPGACRIWVGNETRAPEEVTVTNTVVRTGNYTGNGTLSVGNAASGGSVAFQGDIGWVSAILGNVAINNNMPLPIGTSGAISDAEAEHVKQRWVVPFYQGRPNMTHLTNLYGQNYEAIHWTGLSDAGWVAENSAIGLPVSFTHSGPTLSQRLPFTAPPSNWLACPPYVRR